MNPIAANIVGTGLLKGAFDVLDAMLSCSFQYELADGEEITSDGLAARLSEFPVTLQANIQGDLGAVALLLNVHTAAQMAALIQEQDFVEVEALSDDDRSMLKEIADPALGGGVTNLMERFGRDVTPLENVDLVDSGAEHATALQELLGDGGSLVPFTFTNNADISGSGVALFSQQLESLVPEDQLVAPEAGLATEAELSPDEMNDILSGFGGDVAAAGDSLQGGSRAAAPENLDMVLDIGLVATARLGRVEMPISEILNLGPGSIVEVAHLVDEPVDLLVNGKLIARGDVVVVDEKFGLRITEIISTRARIESLR